MFLRRLKSYSASVSVETRKCEVWPCVESAAPWGTVVPLILVDRHRTDRAPEPQQAPILPRNRRAVATYSNKVGGYVGEVGLGLLVNIGNKKKMVELSRGRGEVELWYLIGQMVDRCHCYTVVAWS